MLGLKQIINENHKLMDKNYSNFCHAKDIHRHRWYYFKEGFSPLIVEEAIINSDLKKGDLIVDPFAGSGTTPLVSTLRGFEGVGFEINPFLAFVSRTKQSQVGSKEFKKYKDDVIKGIQKSQKSELEGISTFSGTGPKNKWLFNTEVIRAFEGGWQCTGNLSHNVRNLYKLILLASAMDNANAYKDGKCLRYKKDWENIKYSKFTFLDTFLEKVEVLKYDLENFPIPSPKAKIFQGDSREMLKKKNYKPFKLCITSPPYLNSFDYNDIYRPELFLGKFVKSNEELNRIRLETIRSHVQVNWSKPRKNDFGALYKQVMAELIAKNEILWNKKIPVMIQAYFEDMEKIFYQLKLNARKDASIWLIVSNSAYAGVQIPVDLILADIGSRVGWKLDEIIVLRHLRNSTQNARRWMEGEACSKRLRESIIIFKGHGK